MERTERMRNASPFVYNCNHDMGIVARQFMPVTSRGRHRHGPELLVLCFIFADEHVLLLRRGTEPYAGFWAPPGGYVEQRESAEAAAIRETHEELGILLEPACLLPLAISSLPAINQIYIAYLAQLESIVPPRPQAPEALEARWFPERAFPLPDIWAPSQGFDMRQIFSRLRAGRVECYQRTEDYLRLISGSGQLTYLSRKAAAPRCSSERMQKSHEQR
jgi:8-oxo-dGTP diphosphatase